MGSLVIGGGHHRGISITGDIETMRVCWVRQFKDLRLSPPLEDTGLSPLLCLGAGQADQTPVGCKGQVEIPQAIWREHIRLAWWGDALENRFPFDASMSAYSSRASKPVSTRMARFKPRNGRLAKVRLYGRRFPPPKRSSGIQRRDTRYIDAAARRERTIDSYLGPDSTSHPQG